MKERLVDMFWIEWFCSLDIQKQGFLPWDEEARREYNGLDGVRIIWSHSIRLHHSQSSFSFTIYWSYMWHCTERERKEVVLTSVKRQNSERERERVVSTSVAGKIQNERKKEVLMSLTGKKWMRERDPFISINKN